MSHHDQVTSEVNRANRDRPVIPVNDRGLMLGLDADGTWIIWKEDDTTRSARTVWPAYDRLLWLLPLLLKPHDVVTEAVTDADADSGLVPELLRFALGSWSDYWAGLALGWLEAGYPRDGLLDALQALKDSSGQPQPIRHRALRLWRGGNER